MLDIKFIRDNPDLVRENLRRRFREDLVPLVDEVTALYEEQLAAKHRAEDLRAARNRLSREIGALMGRGEREAAEVRKREVAANADEMKALGDRAGALETQIAEICRRLPNIVDPTVPVGRDESENVERERFGEPKVPPFEIPYHADLLERFAGLDKSAAARVAGEGFYYLMGDIARLHSAVLSYARDFMIARGFTYVIPPYLIRSEIAANVMSFAEMDAMMYKIEGEDLYLIGTSEHSMMGRFAGQMLASEDLPLTLTSYSPCFRKEKGAHGLEERGIYRIHQFEKQEMLVICRPEDSPAWFERMWRMSVELFRSLEVPVRTLECCTGDLADLKVKSYDVEAWSPRQGKYFEVCSCSNLGDAQARRLGLRAKSKDGARFLPHTLNNTVAAPPRMLIALIENNLAFDGARYTVAVPPALRPYMGGKELIEEQ